MPPRAFPCSCVVLSVLGRLRATQGATRVFRDSLESMPHRPSAVRDDRIASRTEAFDSEAEASVATGTLRQAIAPPGRV